MFFLKKLQYNSPVVLTYVLLCTGALLLSDATGGRSNDLFFCVYRSSLADPLTYFRLFGHVLGHASWTHFQGNVLYLLILGPAAEEKYGSRSLLLAMLVTAFVSGAAHCILSPGTALLGASGVVFMLIFLSSLAGTKNGRIPLTLILVAVFYLGQEIYDALFTTDGISHLTHIIGGVCGTALGFSMRSGRRR